MKTQKLLLLALIFLQISCKSQTKKINGLSFVASRDKIDTTHTNSVLRAQSNYVALMPFGFIRDLSLPKVQHNTSRQWFGETRSGLLQYAKEFQKNDVKIMVKPQLWVGRGYFTGDIEMDTEEKWDVLEKSYTDFILAYAKAAKEINADIFCIGTELEEFVMNRPEYWQNLIKQIKEIYKGKLTYAANWDEYKRVPFWSEIDFIGIDAYFPLSEKKSPTVADLEAGWKPHKNEIKGVQQKYNKSIMFTEFGYRSVDYTGKKPWDAARIEGNINLQAQVNGLQAIHNQFWSEDWFAGGFVWKWFHRHDRVGGVEDNRFTPQNKPAEELIRKLYNQ
ncbi:glycoside hydrolase family 113 [Polaribacter sargassicola]|uniref:glycoside hydrolase family 113 n=1 Tax=Polaribacter sargassicola TaxID=2836891 RepID=UPI001F223E2D|nr:glycoside hydrolase TIM-barrel-like domain-containing protein [Polaribacter sp. DS7-9]MCG1036144.1 glycoside hydrolase TIM-barrel-like domain-containing protein [Polaribacter sp. DS7-9]